MTADAQARPVGRGRRDRGPDVAGILRSEWTKIRSVRSTYWTLLIAAVIIIGIGALIAWGTESHWDQVDTGTAGTFDAVTNSLAAVAFGQLAIVVLGVMAISSEYKTGMIRSTLWAVPHRRLMLGAKALVFAVVTLVVSLIACFAAFFIGHAIYSANPQIFADTIVPHDISNGEVLRAVFGGALYLTVLGVFSFGVGALLRHTAGGIATVVAILLILPLLANFLPGNWSSDVSKYLPMPAGFQVWGVHHGASDLGPWAGFGVLCGYAVAAMVLALFAVNRRDA